MLEILAETTVGSVSGETGNLSEADNLLIDQIGDLLAGRERVALARVRGVLLERLERNQQLLKECEGKIETEKEAADARQLLTLTKLHGEIARDGQGLLNGLILMRHLTEGGRPALNDPRSVNRSSRRTKPPVIVDAELS